MSTTTYTCIPAFILAALAECANAGLVPSVREGHGGNSHSTWFIKFTVRQERKGHYDKLHDFEVKVTSSYGQQFLEFTPFAGPGRRFDGLSTLRTMSECIRWAMADVAALAE